MTASDLAALDALFGPGVQEVADVGISFIALPHVEMPAGCGVESVSGLYAARQLDGYHSRLFLSAPVTLPNGAPPATAVYFNRQWYAVSIQGVSPHLPPHQAILAHLSQYKRDT